MSEDYLAQQPIASWNPVRGVWEIPMENILCGHSGLFSETLPTSGMTQGGRLYPLPVQEHRIDESESLLLRTPQASEASGGTRSKANLENKNHQLMLRDQVKQLFPTPTVSDTFTDNLASSQQSDGSMHSVTLAQIVNRPDLLPTPNTMDMLPARTGEALERTRKRGDMSREHLTTISNLREAVIEMLPTPQVDDSKNNGHNENRRLTLASKVYGETEWGKFAPSIQQWETITGNLAPAPTIPDGKEGQHRLNPAFAEWMMGLPAGWITDCDITRNEQLKACGNGVVPQQATKAITELIKGITI